MHRLSLIFIALLFFSSPLSAETYDGLKKIGESFSFEDEKKAKLEVLALESQSGTTLVGLYFDDAHVYLKPQEWRELSGLLEYASANWAKLDYTGVDGVREFLGYRVKTVGTITPMLEGKLTGPSKRLTLVATEKYATADFKRFRFHEELLADFISKVGAIQVEVKKP